LLLFVIGLECFEQIVVDVFALDSFTDCEVFLVERVVVLAVVRGELGVSVLLLLVLFAFVDQLALRHSLLVFGLAAGDVTLLSRDARTFVCACLNHCRYTRADQVHVLLAIDLHDFVTLLLNKGSGLLLILLKSGAYGCFIVVSPLDQRFSCHVVHVFNLGRIEAHVV